MHTMCISFVDEGFEREIGLAPGAGTGTVNLGPVTPGTHTVLFINAEESLKKSVSVTVANGEVCVTPNPDCGSWFFARTPTRRPWPIPRRSTASPRW